MLQTRSSLTTAFCSRERDLRRFSSCPWRRRSPRARALFGRTSGFDDGYTCAWVAPRDGLTTLGSQNTFKNWAPLQFQIDHTSADIPLGGIFTDTVSQQSACLSRRPLYRSQRFNRSLTVVRASLRREVRHRCA